MLSYGGVADDDEVARPRGEAVDRPFLAEPLEEREEERAPEEVLHVVELCGRDGDPRVVVSPAENRSRQRSKPVGADPRRGGLVPSPVAAVVAAAPGRGQPEADVATRRSCGPRRRRREGGGECRGGHRAGRRGLLFG